ncbi:conserved hypothetical protein [Ricinus communis]|uniref:Secreted protein n=1 Tax=Ricinus communis TaxID=3988 RepID=B9SD49_RICCO|nr:conserved hypothetical protein [Ricinus communis]
MTQCSSTVFAVILHVQWQLCNNAWAYCGGRVDISAAGDRGRWQMGGRSLRKRTLRPITVAERAILRSLDSPYTNIAQNSLTPRISTAPKRYLKN